MNDSFYLVDNLQSTVATNGESDIAGGKAGAGVINHRKYSGWSPALPTGGDPFTTISAQIFTYQGPEFRNLTYVRILTIGVLSFEKEFLLDF